MGIANIAAQIHANMCDHPGFGYDWGERYGGPDTVTWHIEGRDYTVHVGDYDCSSSVCKAWQKALEGTDYEGALDDAITTHNMRSVFERSGLFYSSYDNAERGDVYLNDSSHTAMCQDGGNDDVYGYDCLSEFCIGETGGVYGNQRGDQTGYESYIHGFYEYPWDATLHYNGKADESREEKEMPVVPEQKPGNPMNDAGFAYRVHAQNYGWFPAVRDGQVAGSVGYGMRMEAIKMRPPKGWLLEVSLHIQDIGWRVWTVDGDAPSSGEGTSDGDPIMGTVGQAKRIEAVGIRVLKRPAGDNRKLQFRVHQQNVGWKAWTPEGFFSGCDAQSMRLEAIQITIG